MPSLRARRIPVSGGASGAYSPSCQAGSLRIISRWSDRSAVAKACERAPHETSTRLRATSGYITAKAKLVMPPMDGPTRLYSDVIPR